MRVLSLPTDRSICGLEHHVIAMFNTCRAETKCMWVSVIPKVQDVIVVYQICHLLCKDLGILHNRWVTLLQEMNVKQINCVLQTSKLNERGHDVLKIS